jgi:hypothetical protein
MLSVQLMTLWMSGDARGVMPALQAGPTLLRPT